MRQKIFLKILIPCSLYHVRHIDSNKWGYCKVIHIDGRMDYLNKVMEFKCNTCIILGYLHSLWNMEGHYIALPRPRSNIIPTPYCDNILNHDTNESIVKLITLMVKSNKTITKMKVLQLHIKNLLKWPYTINVVNITLPSCTYTNNFALVHWIILIIYGLKFFFQLYLMFI
jgi:hypothetical protein